MDYMWTVLMLPEGKLQIVYVMNYLKFRITAYFEFLSIYELPLETKKPTMDYMLSFFVI